MIYTIELFVVLAMYLIFCLPDDVKAAKQKMIAGRQREIIEQQENIKRFNGYIEQYMRCCMYIYKALLDARDNGKIGIGEEIDVVYRKSHEKQIANYYNNYAEFGGTLEQYCMYQAQKDMQKQGYENRWAYQKERISVDAINPVTFGQYTKCIAEPGTFTVYRSEIYGCDNWDCMQGIKIPIDGRTGAFEIWQDLFNWNGRNPNDITMKYMLKTNKQYKAFNEFIQNGFETFADFKELPEQVCYDYIIHPYRQ